MSHNPENNNGREEWEDEEEELDEEEEYDKGRREFLRKAIVWTLVLGSGILGIRKSCIEYNEKTEIRKLTEELKTNVDKNNLKLYFYDDVTENCLQRHKVRNNGKVILNKSGKPINSRFWNVVEKMPEDARELVHAKNCHGNHMYDQNKRPVKLARFVAERLQKADQMLWDAEKKHIRVIRSFATNLTQNGIYQHHVVKRKEKKLEPWMAAKPGSSLHELGFAIDVANWYEAQQYMIRAGLIGGMYSESSKMRNKDAAHFSPDLADYFKGSRKNNELISKVTLAKKPPKDAGLLDEATAITEEAREWSVINMRFAEFKILGAATEAYNYLSE